MGKAKITATAENGKKATIHVTLVAKAAAVKSIGISGAPKTLQVGKTKAFSVRITPVKATGAVVSWKSSNAKVLSVDSTGLLTAKKSGHSHHHRQVGNVVKTVKITVNAAQKK